MKNFVQRGDVLTTPNTTGALIASGQGVLLGALFGVAANISAVDDDLVLNLDGVFILPKAASQAWTVGQKVYWDNTNKVCTTTATGNTLIGAAWAPVAGGAGDTTGRVRLNGIA